MPESANSASGARSDRAHRSRRRSAGLALLALLALAVVAERARWFPRLLGLAEVEREWIWSPDPPRKVEPRVFFAVRDFELDAKPARATLEVLGDPEYVAYVGGARVGSGRPGADPEVDRYEIAPLLRTGSNRIVLELRSATGSGAATARVVEPGGRVLVRSDGDWAIYGNFWRGMLEANLSSSRARPPFWHVRRSRAGRTSLPGRRARVSTRRPPACPCPRSRSATRRRHRGGAAGGAAAQAPPRQPDRARFRA
jgi:hypothetical protein